MDEGWACAVTVKGGDPTRLTGPPDQRRKPKPCTFRSSRPPRLDGTEIKFVPSGIATQRRPDELSLLRICTVPPCDRLEARLSPSRSVRPCRVECAGRLAGPTLQWVAGACQICHPSGVLDPLGVILTWELLQEWDKIKSKKLKFLPLLQWPSNNP